MRRCQHSLNWCDLHSISCLFVTCKLNLFFNPVARLSFDNMFQFDFQIQWNWHTFSNRSFFPETFSFHLKIQASHNYSSYLFFRLKILETQEVKMKQGWRLLRTPQREALKDPRLTSWNMVSIQKRHFLMFRLLINELMRSCCLLKPRKKTQLISSCMTLTLMGTVSSTLLSTAVYLR